MTSAAAGLSLTVRGSQGLCLQAPPDFTIHQGFAPDPSKNVKVFGWSKTGSRLAWSNMTGVTVAGLDTQTGNWTTQHQIKQPKVVASAVKILAQLSHLLCPGCVSVLVPVWQSPGHLGTVCCHPGSATTAQPSSLGHQDWRAGQEFLPEEDGRLVSSVE